MGILFILLITALFCSRINSKLMLNDGPLHNFLYSQWITCNHNRGLLLNVTEISVYFYDFENNINVSSRIDNAVERIISVPNLDASKKLILFVPGYRSRIDNYSPELIRQTFRNVPNIYLIIIDHSAYTMSVRGRWKSYENSVKYANSIGQAVGNFLSELHNYKGFLSQNIQCIGHSLGGQIVGFIGTAYLSRTLQRIGRLTGLDPAGPCFANSVIENQIRSECADYVEVYHCNAGDLGTGRVLADTDFFFNDNGRIQPNCDPGVIPGIAELKVADCSHTACMNLWTKTVLNPRLYVASKCDSNKHFARGKCADEVTVAGYSNPGTASGVFFVSTDAHDVNSLKKKMAIYKQKLNLYQL